MADMLKLFHDKRLAPREAHHLEYIKGRLANLKIEDPKAYEDFSAFYGVDVEAKVTKVPSGAVAVEKAKQEEESEPKAKKELKKTTKDPS